MLESASSSARREDPDPTQSSQPGCSEVAGRRAIAAIFADEKIREKI
jgi:hypothetical protein